MISTKGRNWLHKNICSSCET